MSMSERVCGVDVHSDSLVATIMGDSLKEAGRFINDADGINGVKEWLKQYGCNRVVMESSGIY